MCAAVLVIAAFIQGPYFLYVLLRVFICGSAAYIASGLYSQDRLPLVWVTGSIAVLYNPILPVRMARSDWEVVNLLTATTFISFSVYLNWETLSRQRSRRLQQSRLLVRAVAAICTRMKGQDIRILELAATDSALSDFFVVVSAINHPQAIAIADEIELRLKNDWGLCPSLHNHNVGWILLDYADFVVHIFLKEQRAFYDIEGLRKAAKSFEPREFESTIKKYKRGVGGG
jgi:ribosome silencing factor RsfS/YbeB/iojap